MKFLTAVINHSLQPARRAGMDTEPRTQIPVKPGGELTEPMDTGPAFLADEPDAAAVTAGKTAIVADTSPATLPATPLPGEDLAAPSADTRPEIHERPTPAQSQHVAETETQMSSVRLQPEAEQARPELAPAANRNNQAAGEEHTEQPTVTNQQASVEADTPERNIRESQLEQTPAAANHYPATPLPGQVVDPSSDSQVSQEQPSRQTQSQPQAAVGSASKTATGNAEPQPLEAVAYQKLTSEPEALLASRARPQSHAFKPEPKPAEPPQVRIGQISVLIDDPSAAKPARNAAAKSRKASSPFGIRGL